jgi:hypothetical protein
MSEGLKFATLATLVGKRNGARWGSRRVTIGAVGLKDGSRFVMGTFSDWTVVLREPDDFTVATKHPKPSTR